MKKSYNIIFLFIFLCLINNCSTQRQNFKLNSTLKSNIANYYYDNKEITLDQRNKIIKEFDKLVYLNSFTHNKKEINNIYKVGLNITHTTVSLLTVCDNKIFKIYENTKYELDRSECLKKEILKSKFFENQLNEIEKSNSIISSKKKLLPIN